MRFAAFTYACRSISNGDKGEAEQSSGCESSIHARKAEIHQADLFEHIAKHASHCCASECISCPLVHHLAHL